MCIVRYSIDRAERDPYLNVEIVPGNYEFAIHMTVNGKELGVEGIIKVEGQPNIEQLESQKIAFVSFPEDLIHYENREVVVVV